MEKIKFFIISMLGSWLIKLLAFTLRIDDIPQGFNKKIKTTHAIYTFWHCMMLVPAYVGRNKDLQVLISQHSDGEYIAQVIQRLGYGVIRGSTTRGGMRAVKALVDKTREGLSVVVTPDGPRGPRFVFQAGSIFLAKKTQLPIIHLVIGLSGYLELPSWDKFRIPKPFSRALMMYGNPIHVPANITDEEMEQYRLKVEQIMREMTEEADRLVKNKGLDSVRIKT